MQKLLFFFLLTLLPGWLFAQQRTKVQLIRADVIDIDAKTKVNRLQKPIFEHDGAILTCDSARLWDQLNYFEAFGNVHINQGDSINIYSDLLNYDGNAKMAHLIRNVRMKDRTSELTTNIFDYNMGTRIGTYVDKGKIVNDQAVITSQKGFYLARTKDAYFRYNVVVTTDQTTITSDTLRYNTGTDQAYFYGPTNIKGKDDNLYTENGEYNTKTEKAFFGKKNLYTQGTRTLKGDSLYYDGKKGYGRAVKNIFFNDSEDKLLLRGQLGEYYKQDERVVVTINAYVGLGTADSVMIGDKRVPDSLWLGADTLVAQMTLEKKLKLIQKPVVLSDDEVGAETENNKTDDPKTNAPAQTPVSEEKKAVPPKNQATKDDNTFIRDSTLKSLPGDVATKKITTDSLTRDSLIATQPLKTVDTTKNLQSIAKNAVVENKNTPKKVETTQAKINPVIAIPSIKKDTIPDNPADTVRTRTISAYYKVKVFKSNLQARSDSLFFAAADSTLRLYKGPIVWSDSTQQTGDTIHVQFKNKKINNAQIFQNGFIADQESDTTKFNQIKGKTITAFFTDGELRNMYVDGNAESIYFDKKSDGGYQQNQSISARIKITFADKEINTIKLIKGIEGAFSSKVPEKDNILSGFVWKPELRPKDKNDVIGKLPNPAIKKVTPATTSKSNINKPPTKAKQPPKPVKKGTK